MTSLFLEENSEDVLYMLAEINADGTQLPSKFVT
jgi:hypothetical protein